MDPITLSAIIGVVSSSLGGAFEVVKNNLQLNNLAVVGYQSDKEFAQSKDYALYQGALQKRKYERQALLFVTIAIIIALIIIIYIKK